MKIKLAPKRRTAPKLKPAPGHQHRMCMVCREVAPQRNLVRLRMSDGKVMQDSEYTGRGCYVHNDARCISRLGEAQRFQHAFRVSRSDIDMGSVRVVMEQLLNN